MAELFDNIKNYYAQVHSGKGIKTKVNTPHYIFTPCIEPKTTKKKNPPVNTRSLHKEEGLI